MTDSDRQVMAMARMLASPRLFGRYVLQRPLRAYQLEAANAIVESVVNRRGLSFAVMMARQAGKNETSAHVEALLLNRHQRVGGSLVKAAPTYRPQAVNSLRRLMSLLDGSLLPPAVREQGYMLRVGRASATFLSASPGANVVGATANILLEGDEAQDIDADKWNKDFRPMGASTNVTTVLWGTAWTSNTLLARTMRQLQAAEEHDGIRRVFRVPWQRVAREVPAYGRYVLAEVERLGRHHPLIKTQYYLEEIDDDGGLFRLSTRALMRGTHLRQREPSIGREYALLVDVAGEAEEHSREAMLADSATRRDSTALTIVEVVRNDIGLPRFLVMDRYQWVGTPHYQIHGAIAQLADLWGAQHVVVDATGIGAGLTSFLKRSLGERVHPFTFTASSKSQLGWTFLGICGSGRFLDHRDDGSPEQATFWRQVTAAEYEVICGPNRLMRWHVADPLVHDDLLISAALCAVLESDQHTPPTPSAIIEADEPLLDVDRDRERRGWEDSRW